MLQEDADLLVDYADALKRMGVAQSRRAPQRVAKGFPSVKRYSPIIFTNTRFRRPPSNSP